MNAWSVVDLLYYEQGLVWKCIVMLKNIIYDINAAFNMSDTYMYMNQPPERYAISMADKGG